MTAFELSPADVLDVQRAHGGYNVQVKSVVYEVCSCIICDACLTQVSEYHIS